MRQCADRTREIMDKWQSEHNINRRLVIWPSQTTISNNKSQSMFSDNQIQIWVRHHVGPISRILLELSDRQWTVRSIGVRTEHSGKWENLQEEITWGLGHGECDLVSVTWGVWNGECEIVSVTWWVWNGECILYIVYCKSHHPNTNLRKGDKIFHPFGFIFYIPHMGCPENLPLINNIYMLCSLSYSD